MEVISMPRKSQGCHGAGQSSCCSVQSLVTVDERGQMVLPKEIRDKAGIKAGDKLVVIGWEKDGKICCISLVNSNDFSGMVKGLLGPMMNELTNQ
jgi:antitoxin PrlF